MSLFLDEVKNIVSLQLGVRSVSPENNFIEDLGAESMDIVNIIAAVEDKFEVHILEEEISEIRTVSDLVQMIEKKHS